MRRNRLARLVGEFRPPPELAAMSAARVTGKGTIEATEAGLRVDARVLSAMPGVPRWALSLFVLLVVLVATFVPESQLVLVPLTAVVVGAFGWLYWRAEYGQAQLFEVPWAKVEHVVRLASARDVAAIVLSSPVRGWGSPETLYFAPALGVEALAAAMKHAPAHVTVDLESGLAEGPAAAAEE